MINIEQFKSLEIKIGTILSVETIEGADKLLKLSVDMGEDLPRCVVSGIREYVQEDQHLIGLQVAFAANLEPRTIRGIESHGMILATGGGEEPFALLTPHVSVKSGSVIR
jgi:methionyl-tRNA synthetase